MNPKDKLNARQRHFAVNYASGMTQSEAYIQAGYNVDPELGSASDCASRLMQSNASVKAYYNQLMERKASVVVKSNAETIASPLERKAILSEILRARLIDFIGGDGQPKLSRDTPNNRAAKEFYHKRRTDRRGNPIITKSIKLTDPIAAIQELNKMEGSYAPSKHMIAQRVQFEVRMVAKPLLQEEDAVTAGVEAVEGGSFPP